MTEQQPATDRSAAFDQETLSRFWAKVDKTDDCWLWTGPTTRYGYGVFWNGGKRYTAHRISYLLAHGDIPSDLVVDHLCHGWDENCTAEGNRCRHRACVNPNHLEAVTQQVNLLRGHGASGQAARRTNCPQGHPYDEVNTLIEGKTRRCRACREARAAATRTAPPPAERTHCPQGHPYSEENTYRAPNGYRKCRTCKREQDQRARAGSPRRTTSESHRLALSEALGLGTGAPWDAIYERVAELRRVADEATAEHHTVNGVRHLCHTGDHYCPNADGPSRVADEAQQIQCADAFWDGQPHAPHDWQQRPDAQPVRCPGIGETQQPETQADAEPTESVIYEVVGDWGVDSADSAEGARAAVAKWLRAYPKCGAFAQQRICRDWPDGSEFSGPWTDLPAVGAQQPKEA